MPARAAGAILVGMSSYVLVPGTWLGAWCWSYVARALRACEHDVYPVTLTGLGDRAHLAHPGISLQTHVADVAALLRYEDLHDVVLVGHGYGGAVVTAVADRLPERVERLVYVDTVPPADGTSVLDTYRADHRRTVQRQVDTLGAGWRWPMPPVEDLAPEQSPAGLGATELELMRARATAQPLATLTQRLRLGRDFTGPRSGIWCTGSVPAPPHVGVGWAQLSTGHWPMLSAPGPLAALLQGVRPAG